MAFSGLLSLCIIASMLILVSFILHYTSAHVDSTYLRRTTDGDEPFTVYDGGVSVFDKETWCCELSATSGFEGSSDLSRQCSDEMISRWLSFIQILLNMAVGSFIWVDWKRQFIVCRRTGVRIAENHDDDDSFY